MKVVRWIVGGVITFILGGLTKEFTPNEPIFLLVLSLLLAYPVGRYLFLDTRKEEWRKVRFVSFIGALTAAFVLSTHDGVFYLLISLGLVGSENVLLYSILLLSSELLIFSYPVGSFITRQKPNFDAGQREAEETDYGESFT